jgi:hypothetical protein
MTNEDLLLDTEVADAGADLSSYDPSRLSSVFKDAPQIVQGSSANPTTPPTH